MKYHDLLFTYQISIWSLHLFIFKSLRITLIFSSLTLTVCRTTNQKLKDFYTCSHHSSINPFYAIFHTTFRLYIIPCNLRFIYFILHDAIGTLNINQSNFLPFPPPFTLQHPHTLTTLHTHTTSISFFSLIKKNCYIVGFKPNSTS